MREWCERRGTPKKNHAQQILTILLSACARPYNFFFSCYLGLAIRDWLKRHDNEEPCFWNSPWHTRRIEVIAEVTQQLADRQPKVLAKRGNAPWNSWWLTLYFLIWEQFVVHTCGRCCDCPTILHLPTHLHIAIARPSPRHLTLIRCMCYAEYDYNSSTT